MNKQTSIEICRNYIKDDKDLCEIFDNNKKKDDLCDACLQAVAFIRSHTVDMVTNKTKYNKVSFQDLPDITTNNICNNK
jgi:hypothetical protein